MTIQELEYYLSHSSYYPLHSIQSAGNLIPNNLEVCEHILPDGKIVELTLDRNRGKMILEVYRGGDMVGEPLNFFVRSVSDALLGEDWLQLEPVDIIHRVLNRENSLKSA
jgi:hypothetical protein